MKTIGIDVETTREPFMHPWQDAAFLVAVGMCKEDGSLKTWVFNHNEIEPRDQQEMIKEIQAEISTAGRLVGHNLKFDLNWLRKINIDFSHCKLYCTQVAEYLLRGQRIGKLKLSDLSKKYLKAQKIDRVKTFWDAGYETTDIPLNILLPYLEQDCINALAIFQKQTPLILERDMGALVKIQCETTRILSEIEYNGMKFNVERAQRAADDMAIRLEKIDWELTDALDFQYNLNSNDELSVALFGGEIKREGTEWVTRKLKDSTKYYERKCIVKEKRNGMRFKAPKGSELKKAGYYATDKGTISQLVCKTNAQKKVKKFLIERSQLTKALSTLIGKNPKDDKGLINKVQVDGRIHSQYNQTVARTGRLSSKDPNGQNLPREGTSPIKESIEPEYDYIAGADLGQVEWRVAAFQSQDPIMLNEINNGVDPHRENAISVFGANPEDEHTKKFKEIRTIAKIVTFRLLYGGSAFGFWADPKMPNFSKKQWENIVDKFYKKYSGLKAWQDDNISQVYRNGGWLQSVTGRIFHFDQGAKGYEIRQIKNYPVQAMATADIMPLAMCIIYKKFKELKLKSKIIGQVHDSLIFDTISEELPIIAKLCTDVFNNLPAYIEMVWKFEFNVPLGGDVEYGKDYGHLEEYEMLK